MSAEVAGGRLQVTSGRLQEFGLLIWDCEFFRMRISD